MTRTDMPTKDYLGEKWCPHCGRMRSKEKFYRDKNKASGLQSWCKTCQYINVNACHKRKRRRKTLLENGILDKPYFEYKDNYTKIRIDLNGDGYIVLVSSKYEHLSHIIPASKMEEFGDWLAIKLKEKE